MGNICNSCTKTDAADIYFNTPTEKQTLREPQSPQMTFEEQVADMRRISDIQEHYKIGKELGNGSFGSVRIATHKKAGTQFALKIIQKSKLKKKVVIDLMRQELEVSSQIKHPHIITINELLEDDQHVYIVMELMPGGDLLHRVKNMKSFNEKDAARVIFQSLLALNFLHQHEITHRDLKIENILCLNKKDLKVIKLTDFGFARHFDPNHKMYLKLGSPLYMAPELCQNRSYDERVDVWSIGVITYIILSGTPPFRGQQNEQMENQIINDEINFPEDRFSKISANAKDFIMQCLTKDFNQRPHVKEMLQHQWIQSLDDQNVKEDIMINIGQQLKSFQQTNRFQQAVLNFIVGLKTCSQDLEDLNKMFLKLDKDKNGTLDKEELKQGMCELIGTFQMEQTNWEELFQTIDTDGNGVIDHREFIVASFDRKKLINKTNLDMAFDLIDENKTGSLTVDEIKTAFKGDDDTWQEFMEEADKNKDGEISRQEFYKAMDNLMRRTLKKELYSMIKK